MDSSDYLTSPINTLLESLDDSNRISFHDLLDAYHTLATRIRRQIHVIASSDSPLLALTPLKFHSTNVLRAFRRDIRQVVLDPLSGTVPPTLFANESSSTLGCRIGQVEMTRHMKDRVSLCHHTLRVISLIFKFSALQTIFHCTLLADSYYRLI